MVTSSNMVSVLLLALLPVTLAEPIPTLEQFQLSQGINRFSKDFYKATADLNPGQNLVMSPLSAEMALALLSLGAEGDTLEELNRALYLPSKDFTRKAFKPVVEELNAEKGVTLHIANKVFVKKSDTCTLSAQFKKDAVDIFQSEAENVDFGNSVQAARTINSWVENKTNNKIKDLVGPSDLNQFTRLVLVNAIYFKGTWAKAFPESSTRKQHFFLTATEKVKVDMMTQYARFNYKEFSDWDAKMLELPYEGHEMSMVIVLPNRVDGLDALERKLAVEDEDIRGRVNMLRKVELQVVLPKFKIETTIDLSVLLPTIGVTNIFQEGAQLEGLLEGGERLVVSTAVQKAFIEVNEKGSEAAASTAISIQGVSAMPGDTSTPLTFQADHPFYYALLHRGDTLFSGRLIEV